MNGITAACQGRLTADPEYRFTANGTPLLTFRVAVEEHRQDSQASEVQFVAVSTFGDRAQELHDGGKLSKGIEVYCEGRLRMASWTAQDGQPRSGLNLAAWTVQPLGAIGRRANGGQQQRRRPSAPTGQIDDGSRGALPWAVGR